MTDNVWPVELSDLETASVSVETACEVGTPFLAHFPTSRKSLPILSRPHAFHLSELAALSAVSVMTKTGKSSFL